ncbi:MAG TPA: MFS transporter [Solirubrobacteraceae bacterium]|nr:MFS transporter [Solirubrobacteraceae bacterium]
MGANLHASQQHSSAEVRRLLALVSAQMFLELFFYAVLAPLLPELKHQLDLSTTQAGVLVAMYAFGALVGAIPTIMVAVRIGAKRTALASLLAFAAMSLAFGLARSYPALIAARGAQGIAGAACWTAAMVWLLEVAPAERRGEMLGFAFGISEAGAIAGPTVGGIAAAAGRPATFAGITVLCLALAFATTRFPAPPRAHSRELGLRSMLSATQVRTAMGVALLPAIVLAAVSVLAPLRQHRLGAGPAEIAVTFGVAAIVGILVRPLFGRWSDRQGPRRPILIALLVSFPVVLAVPWTNSRFALAVLVIGALVLTGVLWAPLMVMLSDACAAAGVGQIVAVAVMDLSWPPGNALGSTGAAAIAEAAGQRWAYAAIAGALLLGFLMLSRVRESAPDALCLPPG